VSRLAIRGVGKVFPGVRRDAPPTQALQPVSLDIADNDFIAVLGPSGCGKSTLLRLVAGLEEPSSGEILLDDAPIRGPGADRGVVFQSYTLFPWLTVRENICFGLREKRAPRSEQRETSDRFIVRMGLRGFEDHYPKQLSGGMQQRVAIARALANDPKILLMQELLLGIWEQARKTVLFVTHDIDEAIFMANRVVVFSARPGRIKAEVLTELPHPRPYTIKTSPEFMALKARLTEEIRIEALAAQR
jgi:ABC-type nitrate/sulfonate/bicarbonate transport system ATPase subunit